MKKFAIGSLALLSVLLTAFLYFVYPKFMIISGYAAKNMCSCVFVAGMDEKLVKAKELNFNMLSLATTKVDYDSKSVTASVFGLSAKTSFYRNKTGCTLINSINPTDIYRYKKKWNIKKYDSLTNWFSYIDTVEYLTNTKLTKLKTILNSAFLELDTTSAKKNTRATLVLYKGQLVGEKYAPGFNKNSRLMGWSMTKSLTASMLSMLSNDAKLNLNNPTEIETWKNDDRKKITWKQLLHMNSGLRWKENYAEVSDAVQMLFNSDGIGEYATQIPLEYTPDKHWEYSSGTTNILAKAMRSFFNSTDAYIRYPYEKLFYKIGAYSMVMETDAKGLFVGSSYSWATARDWAKIGQLYLQKGNWAGVQILTKKWVNFVQQPAKNSEQRYGGHFWINKGGYYPDVPTDMYAMNGFQGQRVFIIPSKELVIVRLGLTYNRADFDFNQWLKQIIEVIE